MSVSSTLPLSAVDRPLVVRARPDIQPVPVCFAGQSTYVLKDPLTLEVFHLTAEEFFLFDKLKQAMSLKHLQQAFQERFAPRQITPQQLQHGVNQLHSQGLLLSEAAGQGAELQKRGQKRRRIERWQSWLKVLSFRLASIDATAIVDGLHRRLSWLFSWPVLAVAIAVFAYACSLLLGRGGEMVARLPTLSELAQPRYWLLWMMTIVTVKVVHELAHAVTCKHLGARCHEIGVLLLALVPCLYCDVTDAWRLPSKWQRIAVSAAGMIVELFLAAAALILWWHTRSELVQTWCLSVAVVCSIGTLLVNANPLLRYDGYYILSDLVEVPNLSMRAQGLLPGALRTWLLAEPQPDDPLISPRQRRGLWFYAVAARIYLTIVLLGIFAVLLAWARPYHLENLVYTLGTITLLGILYLPIAGVWRFVRNPTLRYRLRLPRLAGLMSLLLALLAVILFFPITWSVSGYAVFVPAAARPVYASEAGELLSALPAGTQVEAGEIIAKLFNPQAELELARQQGEYEVRRVRYEQLETMRTWQEQTAQELPTAFAAVADAKMQLTQLQDKAAELVIRAPRAGKIIAPPEVVDQDQDESRLSAWTGSPLDERNLGCWIKPGTLLCAVGNPTQLEALVMVDQADVAEIQPGSPVRILLESSPIQVVVGEVVQVARRSEERSGKTPALDGGKYHVVQVRLDTQDAALLVGARGTAKIEAQRNTLSKIVVSQLQELLRLPW